MITHYQLNDTEFELEFAKTNLDTKLFNHEAHLRIAWIHIKKYGLEKAISNITHQLFNFVSNLGAKDKYNETLTIVSIRVVYHFMLKSESYYFKEFIEEFPRLKNNFKELLAQHYDIDIINSENAKKAFIAPNLLPID